MRFDSSKVVRTARWILTGVLAATAFHYYYRKISPDTSAVSDSELAQMCKGISGCKSLRLRTQGSNKVGHVVLLVHVVADKRQRRQDIRPQIEEKVEDAWKRNASIMSAPWSLHEIKVTYE